MSQSKHSIVRLHPKACHRSACCLAGILMMSLPCMLAARAAGTIHETRPADAHGSVEIVNVSGHIDVQGWDKAQVDVDGTTGDEVDRVEVTGDGSHTSIRVVVRGGHTWGSGGAAHLTVHLPAGSSLNASLVSCDFKVSGLQGDLSLQSVSGEVVGEVGGDLLASTVSGDVHLVAKSAHHIVLRTVSGDIELHGGDGQTDVTTVSGDAVVALGLQNQVRFKSISGNFTATLALKPDAQIEGESVSGELSLDLGNAPAAQFDVQTMSGDIRNCFGPKPTESHDGSGSRLNFKNGDGGARVHIRTQSGDVKLCGKAV